MAIDRQIEKKYYDYKVLEPMITRVTIYCRKKQILLEEYKQIYKVNDNKLSFVPNEVEKYTKNLGRIAEIMEEIMNPKANTFSQLESELITRFEQIKSFKTNETYSTGTENINIGPSSWELNQLQNSINGELNIARHKLAREKYQKEKFEEYKVTKRKYDNSNIFMKAIMKLTGQANMKKLLEESGKGMGR